MSPTTDGIETLLHLDDPMERRLALKSAAVQPSHLRQALQDEDPKVREAAAKHGNLTPELIKEVFDGNDDWLKHIVLGRSDLRPEDLETLVEDPGFSDELADHPALTPEQKERLNGLPSTPERFKEALMRKNIGYITYPFLGEGRVHQAGGYYPERGYAGLTTALHGRPPTPGQVEHGSNVYTRANGEHATPTDQRRHSITLASFKERFHPRTDRTAGNRSLAATEAHEVQHGVFSRLAQRYGDYGRRRILHATLMALQPEDRNTIAYLFSPHSKAYAKDDFSEEAITHLHNYLQDPAFRAKTHVGLRIKTKTHLHQGLQKNARKAWNSLVRTAASIKPEHIGLTDQTDSAQLKSWTDNLKKSRESDPAVIEDHLGYDGRQEAVQTAIRFLTGGVELNLAIYRARLHDLDGDEVGAALVASGLDESHRQALEGILKLKGVAKAEPAQHTVEPLLPDADEAAKQLGWAFENNDVEPVHLGGKHSKGTMMARDEDGNLLLVKPGSGKQSPAAGAAQEPATQSRREAAFSAVARQWGLGKYVARADLMRIDGRESAVLRMLGLDWTGLHRARTQNPGLPRQALRKYLEDGTLHKWAVLDWVLGNPDRHGNNIMVGPAPAHDCALIDHGSAFAGPDFDPARDTNSFIPYYLRVWGPGQAWSRMSPAERAMALPTGPAVVEATLRYWIDNLDSPMLASILHRHGINPEPSVDRLRIIKHAVKQQVASAAINRLWLTPRA